MKLYDRIKVRLEKLEKTERAASLEAGLSDSFLRNIRDGKSQSPRADTLSKIASVLKTSPQWLLFGEGVEDISSPSGRGFSEEPNAKLGAHISPGSYRLPVYGQAVGGEDGEFVMNGQALFDVLCPPQLTQKTGAYTVMISGDSMYPRYEDGELAFVDPTRRVKKGDYVVAQILMDAYDTCPKAFVKRFIKHNSAELVLEQFNPPKLLSFAHEQVVSVHYIALAGVAE